MQQTPCYTRESCGIAQRQLPILSRQAACPQANVLTQLYHIFSSDRYLRVQANLIEALVVFVPTLLLSSLFVSAQAAAAAGAMWLVGRTLYATGYWVAAAKRGPGFGISLIAQGELPSRWLLVFISHTVVSSVSPRQRLHRSSAYFFDVKQLGAYLFGVRPAAVIKIQTSTCFLFKPTALGMRRHNSHVEARIVRYDTVKCGKFEGRVFCR